MCVLLGSAITKQRWGGRRNLIFMRHKFLVLTVNNKPRYRREDRPMPLYISIRIEFYNGIARFHCYSTAFLYSRTSATVQMLKLHTVRWFHGRVVRHGDSRRSRHKTGKSHDDRNYVIIYSAKKCYNNWSQLRSLTLLAKRSISSVTQSLTNVGQHITNSN